MARPQLMITRDRMAEFSAMRRTAQERERQPVESFRDSSQPRSGGCGDEKESSAESSPWVRALRHFVDLERTVQQKISRLRARQSEFCVPRLLSDEAEARQRREIDRHALDTQTLLRELDRLVVAGMRTSDASNEDEQRAVESARRHLSARLSELIQEFKEGQERFAAQCKRREEKRQRFERIGSHESHARLEKEEKIAQYKELGYTSTDIQELLLEEAKESEVNMEIAEIAESITELHEMFKDLSKLVVEHGTVLDRIDFNVRHTQTGVQRGVEQLQKARASQSTCQVM